MLKLLLFIQNQLRVTIVPFGQVFVGTVVHFVVGQISGTVDRVHITILSQGGARLKSTTLPPIIFRFWAEPSSNITFFEKFSFLLVVVFFIFTFFGVIQ